MIMTVHRLLPMLALLSFLACPTALAWGPDGHRIVGELAERRLSEAALAHVAELLRDEADASLAGVSVWADEIRRQPEWLHSQPWHYVNLPDLGCALDRQRDCPDGDCVFGAIETQRRILADADAERADRVHALKFLVHFVGDVHQPMHAGLRSDRGGNSYQVNVNGEGMNLHRVWDSVIVGRRGLSWQDYSDALEGGAACADGLPEQWAMESCRLIGANSLYPSGHIIDDGYLVQHRPLAEQRLRQAGIRLAALLEDALARTTPSP